MAQITTRTKLIGGMLLLVLLVNCGLGYIAFNRAKQATFIQAEENIVAVARSCRELAQKTAEATSDIRERFGCILPATGNAVTGDIRSGSEHVQASAAELSRLAEDLNALAGQFRV